MSRNGVPVTVPFIKRIRTMPVWSTTKERPLPSCGETTCMGAGKPPAMNRRPTGMAGPDRVVCDGYALKVAASGEFWLVRSVTAGGVTGAGDPVPPLPAQPARTAAMARRSRVRYIPLVIRGR
jgi:hypothetical protein